MNPATDKPALQPPSDLNPRTEPVLDFPDRGLGEMSPADYEALGFMAGLEVHQQLVTKGKLFCRCPAGRRVRHVDAEVLRHMRPTLSELGEYDGCALMEFKTRKEIVYLLERGSVCTYEIDDTPPFPIDDEAIRVALEIALLFGLNLVSELHVMRKQYLDGSIPTGFQRTAMMGLAGRIPFRVPHLGVDRELRIRQFSLEEDSCREVSDIGHRIVFRTDRLGMPLIETVTEPDLLTPREVEAGGRLLAQVVRATGKVRRGAGAARQDTNVSVAGGRRVEIKGVANHRRLPLLTHNEAFRQLNLLRVRAELRRRGVTGELLALSESGRPWQTSSLVVEAGPLLRRCDFQPLSDALAREESAAALVLRGFGGLLVHPTQPGVTFARELADRVRVIACLTGRPFMIHSDVSDYGLSQAEWRALAKRLQAGPGDCVIVLWGPEADVETGVREIFARAREALVGVPAETRQSFPDGTTGFERILPGADRMYPDTDTPPKAVPDAWVEEARARKPELPWARRVRYEALGLPAEMAHRLAGEASLYLLFDALDPSAGPVARRVATALLKRPVRWRRRRAGEAGAAPERLKPLADALARGEMRPEGFERAFERALAEPERAPEELLAAYRPGADDAAAIERAITVAVERCRPLADRPRAGVLRWAMGLVMREWLGKADPHEVAARLAERLGAEPAEVGR